MTGPLATNKKNVFIQILGDWRTRDGYPPNSKTKNSGYGSKVREQTKRSNASGLYGEWAVIAARDLAQAHTEIKTLSNHSLTNIVISTEGQLSGGEAKNTRYWKEVGFGYDDKAFKEPGVIFTSDINDYVKNPPDSSDKKSAGTETHVRKMIGALKGILQKAKTGGSVVIAACQTGYSVNQSTVGKDLGLALSKLSSYRINFYLSMGFCRVAYTDPANSLATGMDIKGSQTSKIAVRDWATGGLLPNGWLKYDRTQKTAVFKDAIINLSGDKLLEWR